MDDRVGEVLDQRAALEGSPGYGLVVSIALHAGVTAVAVWAALHQAPPQMINTLTIRFAPSSGVVAAAPAAPVPRIEPPRPRVQEPPKKSEPVVPPAKNTAPPSPFGRSTRKAADVPPAPAPLPRPAAALPPGAQAAGDIAAGTSGVTGLEGGDFPYTVYIENMKRLIGTHWFRPQVSTGAPVTTVHFVIDRDGSLRDARTESGSGDGAFDRAALRAVLESSPLPPLPLNYSGATLGVHLTFK